MSIAKALKHSARINPVMACCRDYAGAITVARETLPMFARTRKGFEKDATDLMKNKRRSLSLSPDP